MARFLLDTDVIIDFHNRRPAAVALLSELKSRNDLLCTCTVVVAEIYSGLGREQPSRLLGLLDSCEYLAPMSDIARQAGIWRYEYARRGIQLSTTDVLIAATAFNYDATVVTGNVRDYPMPEVSLLEVPR